MSSLVLGKYSTASTDKDSISNMEDCIEITTNMKSNTTKSSRSTFMTLPREIRCLIYSHILVEHPITYKPYIPSFNTLRADDMIWQQQYPCYTCRRWSNKGICSEHEYLYFEHKDILAIMLEPISSPYSILFANKEIAAEFLHIVYKLSCFTFELSDISTDSFSQWVVSVKVLARINICRFQFDMNDKSLLQYDPHHRELHVPGIASELPELRRMEAAIVLIPGMTDGEKESRIVLAKDEEGDGQTWIYDREADIWWKPDREKLTNIFEIPVEELCQAPAGQQCYLIS